MSNLVFPLSAVGAVVKAREPYAGVIVDEAASGKELRSSWWASPRYRYRVGFDVVRSDTRQDYQQLSGMFSRHFGSLKDFLLTDPEDNTVTDHGFAVGDGSTTAFQIQRTIGGAIADAAGFTYPQQTKPYTNMLKNSSFDNGSTNGLATSWSIYNNASATVPAQASIIPGVNGGQAQRIAWGSPNTSQLGINTSAGNAPGWVAGQWYTVSILARASGSNIGQALSLQWNNAPSSVVTIANPALTSSWQRYVFQIYWNPGATIESIAIYISITSLSNTFGTLDFDEGVVVAGQFNTSTLPQPISTPAAATATRKPAYYPAYSDGFEPVTDLAAPPTIYQDLDWMGRRTLYPFARTNLLPWSSAFDNAAWSKTNATIATAAGTAPDGTNTAEQFNEGTVATANHYIQEPTSPTEAVGELRCQSIFLRAGTLPNIWVGSSGVGGGYVVVNLSTGAVSNGGGCLAQGVQTSPLWPGWYRVWFVYRLTGAAGGVYIQGLDAGNNASYTGTSRTFLMWGAMSERVSDLNGPTPYIANAGATATTVTDYSVGSTGIVTLASAPPAGAVLSWDGSYYRRVRLKDASISFERIVQSMWSSNLELVSVK